MVMALQLEIIIMPRFASPLPLFCSFCGQENTSCGKLVAGRQSGTYICKGCTSLVADIFGLKPVSKPITVRKKIEVYVDIEYTGENDQCEVTVQDPYDVCRLDYR